LLIYKEKERVPITEAISKLAITRRTYYRVINLNYKYEETRDRITKIAFDLGVVLPEKGK
jgi:ACT domain-containing protein